uniref:Uncharacterized protein n=1 Tax=Anguilla anguilla TaxID=7936 RepID=A0A0E9PZ27_ANGAN
MQWYVMHAISNYEYENDSIYCLGSLPPPNSQCRCCSFLRLGPFCLLVEKPLLVIPSF